MKTTRPLALVLALVTLTACNLAQATPHEKADRPTLIKNAALVLTMKSTSSSILNSLYDVDVLFDQTGILKIGPGLSAPHATVIDGRNRIVLPGFVDTHDHLWQSLIRGCGADQDLNGWLEKCNYPYQGSAVREDDVYAAVRLSTLGLIETGVTSVLDDSHSRTFQFVEGNMRALEESGLRFAFAYCGNAAPEVLAHIKKTKTERIDPNPKARFQLCSHPARAGSTDLKAMSDLAKQLNVPLNVHLLENAKDREDQPIDLLKSIGALNDRLIADHVVNIDSDGIQQLGEHGVRVTYNPLSNMRLASGIAPIPELHQKGVVIGLGLDGGSNDNADFFNLMKVAVGLQRAQSKNAKIYPGIEDVLFMATMGGARVLGLEKSIGSLEPGKQADLIILRTDSIQFGPKTNWINQLVLNGRPSDVDAVFVGGKALKLHGKLLNVSEPKIVKAVEAARARLKVAK